MSLQLLNKQLKESTAQVEALNYQRKLYRVSEATSLVISVVLSAEADEDSLGLVPPRCISGGAAEAGGVGGASDADAAGEGAGVQQHGLQKNPEL